ncbi:MAG: WecB/TagA/CpsF family glycosyltransferase [Patescibacteria group bacterium]|nr:WecB/TagA/CpsF family glycosyltransferase [Patescibacteria group bacterium]
MENKIFLLGVGFNNLKMEDVLELIIKGLVKSAEKYYVVTPNPEILVLANNNLGYKKVITGAKLALPDGIGVMMAAKLLGKPLKERIHGVDLMERLCKEVSKRPITVGFLGAGPNVAEEVSECLREKYPGLKVVFTAQEWDKNNFKFQISNFKSMENDKWKMENSIDILFVAFGSPKQEIWIAENLSKLPVKVAIGVGGAFDFISGKVRRAPVFVRKLGLEWLFRLIIQPRRIKRQLRLIKFIYLVLKEKFRK